MEHTTGTQAGFNNRQVLLTRINQTLLTENRAQNLFMETHCLTAAVLGLERAAESPAEVVKPDYRAALSF